MNKEELVRLALRELGDVPAKDLSVFIEQRHGVLIEPKFIPIFKASIRAQSQLEEARQAAKAVLDQIKAEAPTA
jgi:hypothetical protein